MSRREDERVRQWLDDAANRYQIPEEYRAEFDAKVLGSTAARGMRFRLAVGDLGRGLLRTVTGGRSRRG